MGCRPRGRGSARTHRRACGGRRAGARQLRRPPALDAGEDGVAHAGECGSRCRRQGWSQWWCSRCVRRRRRPEAGQRDGGAAVRLVDAGCARRAGESVERGGPSDRAAEAALLLTLAGRRHPGQALRRAQAEGWGVPNFANLRYRATFRMFCARWQTAVTRLADGSRVPVTTCRSAARQQRNAVMAEPPLQGLADRADEARPPFIPRAHQRYLKLSTPAEVEEHAHELRG